MVLTLCPRCGSKMHMADVTGTTPLEDDYVSVAVLCPECSLLATMKISGVVWAKFAKDAKDARPTVKSDERRQPQGRRIGQVVKAFREVELAQVYTIDDITWVWEAQEAMRPESIPLEV